MRNLSEYPITLAEKIEAMNWAVAAENTAWEAAGRPIGGVRGVALAQIRADLMEQEEASE